MIDFDGSLGNIFSRIDGILKILGPLISCRLYFTKVKLGSPPREFNVQIDTGSDILWVNCNSCSDCPQSSGLGVRFCLFNLFLSLSFILRCFVE